MADPEKPVPRPPPLSATKRGARVNIHRSASSAPAARQRAADESWAAHQASAKQTSDTRINPRPTWHASPATALPVRAFEAQTNASLLVSMFSLVPGSFMSRVAWAGMMTTDAALLGHVSTFALESGALSDLWTSTIGSPLIHLRVLGVFVGNACGAGNPQAAGEWLQVALFTLGCLFVPVAGLWAATEPVLRVFGMDYAHASAAGFYSTVLLAGVPARIAFNQFAVFFSAQGLVRPAAEAGLIGLVVNLLLGIAAVTGVPGWWTGLGFHACPAVTSFVAWLQLGLLLGIHWQWRQLHKAAWPKIGWSFKHVTRDRIFRFLQLSTPAILSGASDFWCISLVGLFAAAHVGSATLAAYNASYRWLWLSYVFAGSLANAIGIGVAQRLGAGHTELAQRELMLGLACSVLLVCGLGVVAFFGSHQLGALFSSDEAFLKTFVDSSPSLALLTTVRSLAITMEGLLQTLGQTKLNLAISLTCAWLVQIPACIWLTTYWSHSLTSLFLGVAIGYGLQCALLLVALVKVDWRMLTQAAAQRADINDNAPTAEPTAEPTANEPAPTAAPSRPKITAAKSAGKPKAAAQRQVPAASPAAAKSAAQPATSDGVSWYNFGREGQPTTPGGTPRGWI